MSMSQRAVLHFSIFWITKFAFFHCRAFPNFPNFVFSLFAPSVVEPTSNPMFIKNAATPCRITNLPSNLQQTVDTLFPEGRHPDPSMIRPDVFAYVTQDNTNISFTFISTGAGNKNRLGYARYNSLTNSVIGSPYMESSIKVIW